MSYSGIKKLDNGKLHAVRYIFEEGLSIKELEEQGIVRLKSGISSNTLKGYKTETIRTDSTGKKFLLWDDTFIDQNLTLDIAAEIISLMDKSFKQIMINEGFHSRTLHNDRTIGTEFYESDDRDSLIEIIERNWERAYRIAYEFVTKTELPNGIEVLPFEPRPNQDILFINPLVEYFKTGDKATAQSHGGTGKTKMSFRTSEIVCKEVLNTTWKTLMFSDNIANTVQLTAEFAKFYKGQTGKRIMDIYLIGSASPKDYKLLEAWANVFPVSNTEKVIKALKDSYSSNRPSAFFVVNKSAEKFLKLAEKAGVDFKNWFTALDEIQQYANETDQPKVITSSECAVINPRFDKLFGKKLGLSATHIVRDPEICNDLSAVFNDDEDKFGPRIVDIDEITARSLGWISDKQGVIIPLPATPEFLQSVEEKRPLQVTIDDESITIHPQYFVAVEGLVKYILPQNKTHILLLSTYIKDIQLLSNLFRILQEKGKIDSDYEIIEGYSKCGNSCVNQFNKAKKAIMIATRWIGVGQDTYKCDCTFPLYNPSSRSFARQFSMRGDRVYEDKVSLLAFVAIEKPVYVDSIQSFRDSIWFESLENISNGSIPNIVSESEFRERVTREVIGSNRNPNDGANVGNITVVRSTNNDPIFFENWETLSQNISARTFTDNFGNSRFSDIINFLQWDYKNPTQKMFNRAVEIARSCKSLHEFNGWEARKTGETPNFDALHAFLFLRKTNIELLSSCTDHMPDGPYKPDEVFKYEAADYKDKFDELGFKYWDEVESFFNTELGEEKGKQMYLAFARVFSKRVSGKKHYCKRPAFLVYELTTGFHGNATQAKKKFGISTISLRKWAAYGKPIPDNPSAPQYNGLHFRIDPICATYMKNRIPVITKPKDKTKFYKKFKELFSGKIGTVAELAKEFNVTTLTVSNSVKFNRPLKGRQVQFAELGSKVKPLSAEEIKVREEERLLKMVETRMKKGSYKHTGRKKGSYKHSGKSITQFDKEGSEVKRWNNIKEVASELNINIGSISNVLNGWAKTAGGFKFKYTN